MRVWNRRCRWSFFIIILLLLLSEQVCVSEYLYIGTYKYFYVSTFLEVVWRKLQTTVETKQKANNLPIRWNIRPGHQFTGKSGSLASNGLSSLLAYFAGDKHFFFGSTPTEVDCTLFGHLSQFVWQARRSPGEKLINGKLIMQEAGTGSLTHV